MKSLIQTAFLTLGLGSSAYGFSIGDIIGFGHSCAMQAVRASDTLLDATFHLSFWPTANPGSVEISLEVNGIETDDNLYDIEYISSSGGSFILSEPQVGIEITVSGLGTEFLKTISAVYTNEDKELTLKSTYCDVL